MKILMLTPYLPYPLLSGGQIRTYNLLKELSGRHEITLFALIKDHQEKKYIKDIQPFCQQVRVFKRSSKPFTAKNVLKTAISTYPFLVIRNLVPEAVSAVKAELNHTHYDLIHAETFYMMPHIPNTRTPILLVEQTIEYLGYESYAKKIKQPLRHLLEFDINKIKRWEQFYWKKADKLITMSGKDQAYIQQYLSKPEKVEVVFNGVDNDWFAQVPHKLSNDPTVIYVGTFKWLPNVEAAKYLIKKVWPKILQLQPNAQLKIVGNEPTDELKSYQEKSQNVQVLGRVPDIRYAFKQAHVLLAPVFSGKGTRYKILESLASGTPVVATPTAVEGLNLKHNQHVLIGDNSQTLANYVANLFEDKKLWQKLSTNGKKFVKQHYDWQPIANKLDKIYQSMQD